MYTCFKRTENFFISCIFFFVSKKGRTCLFLFFAEEINIQSQFQEGHEFTEFFRGYTGNFAQDIICVILQVCFAIFHSNTPPPFRL